MENILPIPSRRQAQIGKASPDSSSPDSSHARSGDRLKIPLHSIASASPSARIRSLMLSGYASGCYLGSGKCEGVAGGCRRGGPLRHKWALCDIALGYAPSSPVRTAARGLSLREGERAVNGRHGGSVPALLIYLISAVWAAKIFSLEKLNILIFLTNTSSLIASETSMSSNLPSFLK